MASSKTKKLRVSHIRIRNILGIDELEFRPGQHVTMISGANGTGKTSVLEAIRAVLKGGHDAELVHKGEKSGEVVIVLSDGLEISKKISLGRSAVNVKHPDSGPMDAPQSVISELTDSMGANPVEFLTASSKDRVKLFLGMVNATPDPEKLGAITSLCSPQFTPAPDAFTTLGRAMKDLVAQRREINRQAKEKREGAKQIRSSLPEGDAPGKINEILTETRKVILLRQTQADESIDRINRGRDEAIRKISQEADAAIAKAREDRDAAVSELNSKIEELEAHQKATAARELAENMEAGAKGLEADSETFTETIGKVTELERELCSQLPIKGAEILDGELFIDGVPFDHVNESKKVQIAIDLAVHHIGDKRLPLICVDGLETLDSDSLTLFLEAAAKTDCQLIVTRVSDIPGLSIETEVTQ